MAEVLLFHHAQGLTPGVRAFADTLRAAGHTMHMPDLFDGRTFGSIDEGLAYIGEIGFDAMRERGVQVADALPPELVYAGMSFGVLPAQKLAQTRPGCRGALLFYSCLPISGEWAFGPWPDGVPVQIHGMDNDPIFVGEGDIHTRRPRDRGEGQGRGAFSVPRRPALLRRQLAPVVRRECDCAAHQTRA
jgi:dienelactone hydrolase